jgi:CheY-like chemotaxis protein
LITAKSFVEVLPSLLWVLLAATALAVFYRPLRRDVIPNLRSVRLPGGIEFGIGDRVQAAAKDRHVPLSHEDKSRIVRRLERAGPVIAGARILWVDDNPANNLNEATTLGTFGAVIRFAKNNREARELVDREHFDVVITDWRRPGEAEDAGKQLVEATGGKPWTIFYVGEERPKPEQAFALTTQPHQLLHYTLDALERSRG